MKHITASKLNDTDWSRAFVDETDYRTLLTEDATVMFEGKPLVVFLKNVVPLPVNVRALAAVKRVGLATNNRGTASGIKAKYKEKLDGTVSKTLRVQNGWAVNSGLIGFFEREVRRPYCHACVNNERTDFGAFASIAECVDKLFARYCPEAYSYQSAFASRTPNDWLIGDSIFTTITANKNFRTACHKDAGDLAGGRSCMTVLEEGVYKGANLVLPAFGLAVDIRMGDLIIFDPHQFHGNTQIIPVTRKAARYSLVYYYREKMQFCKTPDVELEQAKNRKPGDRLYPEET